MGLLAWALIFLVVAIIAAVFGFGGIASTSAGIARVLFFIVLVVFVVLLLMGLLGGAEGMPDRVRGLNGGARPALLYVVRQHRGTQSGFASDDAPLIEPLVRGRTTTPERVGHLNRRNCQGGVVPEKAAGPIGYFWWLGGRYFSCIRR